MEIVQKKLCIVIGDPVSHSMSPAVHTVAYRALGIEDNYCYCACHVKSEELESAIKGVRALGILSVSCTLPHKQSVIPFLDEIDASASSIQAVNTIVNRAGRLVGYNTDIDGVVQPFLRRTTLAGKRVLLLGAGGAARAAAYGFVREKAELTITNRTQSKAEQLADELSASVLPWEERETSAREFDIIFNATSVGFSGNNTAPLDVSSFRTGQLVCDAIYNPYLTPFLANAKQAGVEVIHGTEMFIEQAAQQLRLYAGVDAPRDVMEQVLLEELCRE